MNEPDSKQFVSHVRPFWERRRSGRRWNPDGTWGTPRINQIHVLSEKISGNLEGSVDTNLPGLWSCTVEAQNHYSSFVYRAGSLDVSIRKNVGEILGLKGSIGKITGPRKSVREILGYEGSPPGPRRIGGSLSQRVIGECTHCMKWLVPVGCRVYVNRGLLFPDLDIRLASSRCSHARPIRRDVDDVISLICDAWLGRAWDQLESLRTQPTTIHSAAKKQMAW